MSSFVFQSSQKSTTITDICSFVIRFGNSKVILLEPEVALLEPEVALLAS
jgi:hypothetical protein